MAPTRKQTQQRQRTRRQTVTIPSRPQPRPRMSVGGLATGGAAVRPTVSSDLDLLSAGASVVGVLGLFAVLFSAALANAIKSGRSD